MAERAAGDDRPRTGRGLLLAPLPLVLGVGGLVGGMVLDPSTGVEPAGGLHFTPELVNHGPRAVFAALFWSALAVSLGLVRVFYTWGRSGRPPHRLLAGVAGLQWLGVGMLLALQWAAGVLPLAKEAGSWSPGFLVAGLTEAFSLTLVPVGVLLGWLVAWLVACGVSTRWGRPAPSVRPRPGVLLLLATGVAAATLCERFWASRLFVLLEARADAPAWPPDVEQAAVRWAVAHGGVLVLWMLLVLVLLPAALGRRRRVRRTWALVFVLALWTGESLARRAVFHDAARLLGATRLTSAGPVRAAAVTPSGALWPQAGLQAERAGLRASSGRLVPWSAGAAALEDVLARERAEGALDASEAGQPTLLAVTVGEDVRAEELACLLPAARARGVRELVLVGGPPVRPTPALERAVVFIYAELRRLLGPRGHAVTLRTAPDLRMPPPSWVVVLAREGAPFVRPRDAASPPLEEAWPVARTRFFSRGHPRIPLVLEPGAPVAGLWSAAKRLGGGTFEVESSPPCVAAEARAAP